MKTFWRCIVLTAAMCSSESLTQATEPNETFGDSTVLAPGVLSVSDDLTSGFLSFPDTLLGARDLFGSIFLVDDDSSNLGDGFASGFSDVPVNGGGGIAFAISGFGDDSFDGNHGEFGEYEAVVEVFNLFGDPVDEFSLFGTLEPGLADEYSFSDFNWLNGTYTVNIDNRSEERRVGKECRSRWSPYH